MTMVAKKQIKSVIFRQDEASIFTSIAGDKGAVKLIKDDGNLFKKLIKYKVEVIEN